MQHICVHLQHYQHHHSLSGSVFVFGCDATFNLFQEEMQQECKVFRKKTKQCFLQVEGEERVVAWIVSHIRCFWTLCTYIYIYFYLSYFKNTKDEYKLQLFVEKKNWWQFIHFMFNLIQFYLYSGISQQYSPQGAL